MIGLDRTRLCRALIKGFGKKSFPRIKPRARK